MSRVIMIASGKGGVGKSTVCANLGLMLAEQGNKVCLIDVDLGLKNLDVILGLENRVLYDLKDVMEKRCSIDKVIIQDKRCENLYLLPACKSVNIKDFRYDDFQFIVEELKTVFDFILLDSPAGIETGFHQALKVSDEVLLVIQLDVTSIQDSDRVVGIVLKERMHNIKVIVNRMNPEYIKKGISLKLREALEWLSLDLLGIVYEDEWLIASNNRGTPRVYDRKCLTYECYKTMALRLLGEQTPLPKYPTKKLLDRLLNR